MPRRRRLGRKVVHVAAHPTAEVTIRGKSRCRRRERRNSGIGLHIHRRVHGVHHIDRLSVSGILRLLLLKDVDATGNRIQHPRNCGLTDREVFRRWDHRSGPLRPRRRLTDLGTGELDCMAEFLTLLRIRRRGLLSALRRCALPFGADGLLHRVLVTGDISSDLTDQ